MVPVTIQRMSLALSWTFDDGPGPSTRSLLAVLRRYGVRATFFVTGLSLDGHSLGGDGGLARALCLEALCDGHTLGNHTERHRRDPMSLAAFADEVRATDARLDALYAEAGVRREGAHPFRLPYGPLVREGGLLDERLGYLSALGRTHTHWTGIFDDWEPDVTADALIARIAANVATHHGLGLRTVLCLHDAGTRPRANGFDRGATVAAVDRVLRSIADGEDPTRWHGLRYKPHPA